MHSFEEVDVGRLSLKTTVATAANAAIAAANGATIPPAANTTAVAPAAYTTADVDIKEKVTRLEQAQMREAFALSLNVTTAATACTTTTTAAAANATATAAAGTMTATAPADAANMTAAVATTNTTIVAPAAANITTDFDVKEKVTRLEQAQIREALELSVNVTAVAPTASTTTAAAANATSAAIAAVDNGRAQVLGMRLGQLLDYRLIIGARSHCKLNVAKRMVLPRKSKSLNTSPQICVTQVAGHVDLGSK